LASCKRTDQGTYYKWKVHFHYHAFCCIQWLSQLRNALVYLAMRISQVPSKIEKDTADRSSAGLEDRRAARDAVLGYGLLKMPMVAHRMAHSQTVPILVQRVDNE